MTRNRSFRVRNNRFQFICPECRAKRTMAVPANVRHRHVRCHKCGARLRCLLNRRDRERQTQTGRVTMILRSGKEVTADLHDISPTGIGCDVHPRDSKSLKVRQEVKFKCGWNSQLVEGNRYVIQSVNGNRIGLKNLTARLLG